MEIHLRKYLVAIAGFLCVAVPSHRVCAQSAPLPTVQNPGPTSPTTRPNPNPLDDFAGLTFTEDQKTQIRKIQEDMRSRLDIVAKDPKLDSDQKAAMLDGYERMEYREIFNVLTPDQQAEVRRKVRARRESERQQQQPRQPPPPK